MRQPLNDHQKKIIEPMVQQTLRARAVFDEMTKGALGVVSLIEPKLLDPNSGVFFDFDRQEIVYPEQPEDRGPALPDTTNQE